MPYAAGPWRVPIAMRGRLAGCRRFCWRRVTSPGSQRWPPRRRAEAVLQDLDLYGLVADLGLEVVDEAVAVVWLPGLEPCLHGGEGLFTPLGEPAGRDAELPAEGNEGLAPEEPQDDLRPAQA